MMTPEVTPLSLEAKLTWKWEFAKAQAEATIKQAEYNLGRLSMIYSGQLSLELESLPDA